MKTKTKNRKSAAEELSSHGKEPTIEGATASYEAWMRSCTKILQSDLRLKHEQMKESPFGPPAGRLLPVGATVAIGLLRSLRRSEGSCGRRPPCE